MAESSATKYLLDDDFEDIIQELEKNEILERWTWSNVSILKLSAFILDPMAFSLIPSDRVDRSVCEGKKPWKRGWPALYIREKKTFLFLFIFFILKLTWISYSQYFYAWDVLISKMHSFFTIHWLAKQDTWYLLFHHKRCELPHIYNVLLFIWTIGLNGRFGTLSSKA